MSESSNRWEANSSSQFHFHEWTDGVAAYLEGEGGTYLLSPFAADLLKWLIDSPLTTHTIADRLLTQYPDDTLDNIITIVDETLRELRTRGLVVRVTQ